MQWSQQVEAVPLLTGEDGGLLVVLHQLIHGGEAALANAEHALHRLHPEVLVLAGRFEGHREVVWLGRGREIEGEGGEEGERVREVGKGSEGIGGRERDREDGSGRVRKRRGGF